MLLQYRESNALLKSMNIGATSIWYSLAFSMFGLEYEYDPLCYSSYGMMPVQLAVAHPRCYRFYF